MVKISNDRLPVKPKRIRVVFTVEAPADRWQTEELKTLIAVAITESVPEEVPGAKIHWHSLGGSKPEVVETAEMYGRSVRRQMELDANDYWS